MNEYIKHIIANYEYPLVNSIIYSDGTMLVLESYKIDVENYFLRVLCKSNIESYFKYNSFEDISSFSAIEKVESEVYQIFAGGGSMGGDGIVFVMDKSKDSPLWFLFLDNSNPFEKVRFEDYNIIVIQSSSGLKIRIPIDNPEQLKVV